MQHAGAQSIGDMTDSFFIPINYGEILIEGSLEVKLPTIWTVEKQR